MGKFNAQQTENLIAVADGKGVQILVFPELNLTGYFVLTCSASSCCWNRLSLLSDGGREQYPPVGDHFHCGYAGLAGECYLAELCRGFPEG